MRFTTITILTFLIAAIASVNPAASAGPKLSKLPRGGTIAPEMSRVRTQGPGTPVVVLNTLSWTRTDGVVVRSPFTGQSPNVRVVDSTGRAYPARAIGDKLCFTARDIPPMGYKVYWIVKSKKPVQTSIRENGSTIENSYFRVHIDPDKGFLTSIYDKIRRREVLTNEHSSLLRVLLDKPKDLLDETEVVTMDRGPARVTMVFDHTYNDSLMVQEVTLIDGVPRIDIRLTAEWLEPAPSGKTAPSLAVSFSPIVKDPKATYGIPNVSATAPADWTSISMPKWIDIWGNDYGMAVISDCRHGFSYSGDELRALLLKSSEPTDMGVHEISYSIYPHDGNWQSAYVPRRAFEITEPLLAWVAKPHKGDMPASGSFASLSDSNGVIAIFKESDNADCLTVTFREIVGTGGQRTIRIRIPAKALSPIDQPDVELPLTDGKFTLDIGKNEVKSFRIVR